MLYTWQTCDRQEQVNHYSRWRHDPYFCLLLFSLLNKTPINSSTWGRDWSPARRTSSLSGSETWPNTQGNWLSFQPLQLWIMCWNVQLTDKCVLVLTCIYANNSLQYFPSICWSLMQNKKWSVSFVWLSDLYSGNDGQILSSDIFRSRTETVWSPPAPVCSWIFASWFSRHPSYRRTPK